MLSNGNGGMLCMAVHRRALCPLIPEPPVRALVVGSRHPLHRLSQRAGGRLRGRGVRLPDGRAGRAADRVGSRRGARHRRPEPRAGQHVAHANDLWLRRAGAPPQALHCN